MHEYLLMRDILHADETQLQVLHEPWAGPLRQNRISGFTAFMNTRQPGQTNTLLVF